MDRTTIFATLALLGGVTITGCAGNTDSTEVPRSRTVRGGQGSCGGSAKAAETAKAEAGCGKKATASTTPTPPTDVQEAPAPEAEEAEMLCGAPGEKRCA